MIIIVKNPCVEHSYINLFDYIMANIYGNCILIVNEKIYDVLSSYTSNSSATKLADGVFLLRDGNIASLQKDKAYPNNKIRVISEDKNINLEVALLQE